MVLNKELNEWIQSGVFGSLSISVGKHGPKASYKNVLDNSRAACLIPIVLIFKKFQITCVNREVMCHF